jgi:hypothetical protein
MAHLYGYGCPRWQACPGFMTVLLKNHEVSMKLTGAFADVINR